MQIIIYNILFEFQVQDEIKPYFEKRVVFSQYNEVEAYTKIYVTVELDNHIALSDVDFWERSEPKFTSDGFIREIPNIGVFIFDKNSKKIKVNYINNQKHAFDVLEVVVDSTMQAVDLSTIFFDILPLHAAVVQKNGYGIIIMGASNSGKTTTESLLIQYGFDYFSDDILFLNQKGMVYNNQEYILPMREPTVQLMNDFFEKSIIFNHHEGEKYIDRSMNLSSQKNVIPAIILLPGKVYTHNKDEKPYIIQKIDNSELYISLLKETISLQFPPEVIKLYLYYLKKLCMSVTGYRILRTQNYKNIFCHNLMSDLMNILLEHNI